MSSHVRQMGAAKPRSKRSRNDDSAPTEQARLLQRRQRVGVALTLIRSDKIAERGVRAVVVAEDAHETDQLSRLQEDEPPSAVVVRQRAEALITKRNLFAQIPVLRGVKGVGDRGRHVLVDPTQAVDRDLLDE